MKLELRSSGGFSGPAGAVTRRVDVGAQALPADKRQALQVLLNVASLFEQPSVLKLDKPHSWDFNYVLTAEDGARKARIEFHLEALPAPLRALVDWLEDEIAPS